MKNTNIEQTNVPATKIRNIYLEYKNDKTKQFDSDLTRFLEEWSPYDCLRALSDLVFLFLGTHASDDIEYRQSILCNVQGIQNLLSDMIESDLVASLSMKYKIVNLFDETLETIKENRGHD